MIAQFFGPTRAMAATACVGVCLFGALLWLTWSISRHPAAFYADPLAVAVAEPPLTTEPETPEPAEATTKPAGESVRLDNPPVEKSVEPSTKPVASDARAAARKAAHAKAAQQRAAERARARRNTFDQEAPRSAARQRGGDFISDFLNAFQ